VEISNSSLTLTGPIADKGQSAEVHKADRQNGRCCSKGVDLLAQRFDEPTKLPNTFRTSQLALSVTGSALGTNLV
jgi:hypothetical protein